MMKPRVKFVQNIQMRKVAELSTAGKVAVFLVAFFVTSGVTIVGIMAIQNATAPPMQPTFEFEGYMSLTLDAGDAQYPFDYDVYFSGKYVDTFGCYGTETESSWTNKWTGYWGTFDDVVDVRTPDGLYHGTGTFTWVSGKTVSLTVVLHRV